MKGKTLLLVGVVFLSSLVSLAAAKQTRYYKMESGVGAAYMVLAPNGTYTRTVREHMGVWVEESGKWTQSGTAIVFTTETPKNIRYKATEIAFRGQTFLTWTGEDAPGTPISVDETKREIKQDPTHHSLYVFFRTTSEVFHAETKTTYPFHTRPSFH